MAADPPALTPPPAGITAGVTGAQQQALQHLAEIVIEQVPQRMALIARTILLSGMITGQKEGGALVLRTQVGDLVIRSQTPLPEARVLTLQIPPGAPPVRAQVFVPPLPQAHASATTPLANPATSLPASLPQQNALSPTAPAVSPSAPRTTPLGPPNPPITLQTPAPASTLSPPLMPAIEVLSHQPLQPGLLLPAKVMATPEPWSQSSPKPTRPAPPMLVPAPAAASAISAPQMLSLQTLLPSTLAQVIAKLPPSILSPEAPLPQMAAPLRAPQSPLPPAATQAPAFALMPKMLTLPPGAQVMLQVIQVATPNVKMPVVAPLDAPLDAPVIAALPVQNEQKAPPPVISQPVIKAMVIGRSPQGETIATSPAGLLVLESKTPLPQGTLIDLALVQVSEPPAEDESFIAQRGSNWPGLLAALAAPGAQGLAPHRILKPEAPGQALLFSMVALRMATPESFTSPALANALRQSPQGEALLAATQQEMQQAGQSWSRSPEAQAQGEWRSFALPVPLQSGFERLQVHLRQEQEAQAAAGETLKHLVIELEMSRLGPMLLDGYIRRRQFDMTLRSQRRLPQPLQQELQSGWLESISAVGFRGSLQFQTAADLWLEPK